MVSANLFFCLLHLFKMFSSLLSLVISKKRMCQISHRLFPSYFQFFFIRTLFCVNYLFLITWYLLNASIFLVTARDNTEFRIYPTYCEFTFLSFFKFALVIWNAKKKRRKHLELLYCALFWSYKIPLCMFLQWNILINHSRA